jgi:hypothetical protein
MFSWGKAKDGASTGCIESTLLPRPQGLSIGQKKRERKQRQKQKQEEERLKREVERQLEKVEKEVERVEEERLKKAIEREKEKLEKEEKDDDRQIVLPRGQSIRDCFVCRKRIGTKRCGRCEQIYYCGKDCQRKDWTRHEPKCCRTTWGHDPPVRLAIISFIEKHPFPSFEKMKERAGIFYDEEYHRLGRLVYQFAFKDLDRIKKIGRKLDKKGGLHGMMQLYLTLVTKSPLVAFEYENDKDTLEELTLLWYTLTNFVPTGVQYAALNVNK